MIIIAQTEEEYQHIRSNRALYEANCEFWLIPAYLPRLVMDNWGKSGHVIKNTIALVESLKVLETPKEYEQD